jgi:hypothetical protein
MAGQDLSLNINTKSDVPQAMDKAKAATVSFSKQIEDIQKKFSTTFKDTFLSFLGPMALITGAIALIAKLIADNQRKRDEATQAAIDATNKLISAEDTYWARKTARENKDKKTIEEAQTAREETTLSFLQTDPRGKAIVDRTKVALPPGMSGPASFNAANELSRQKAIQDEVQKIIAEELAANGQIAKPGDMTEKAGTFKGPEGFSSVVGVGANPVMEKMTKQNELLEEIKEILWEQTRINSGGQVPNPFTERVPITLMKIGSV